MCEMLGISAKRKVQANDILREFYSHAERHPHGWGLAAFNDAGVPAIEKEAIKATESEYLRKRLSEPIEESVLLAHIRLATVGHLEYRNSHPFTAADNCGRIWTLEHNGTIFNGAKLNRYMGLQFGSTDSERILLRLVDIVNERQIRYGRALDWKERFAALDDLIGELAGGNKLNLLVYDGEILYAHTNFRGSLHVRQLEGELVFSTKPLSGDGWNPLPLTRLVAAKDGEIVREGAAHEKEYIYNPNDYRFLYMDFATL